MMQLDRLTLGRMAKELGFVRDTLEKVCRLADVLKFMESDELLSESIVLKGGTAINLTIFDLPRLSVDIDLDYCRSIDREKMLADRDIITDKFELDNVGNVSKQQIKRDLDPVLRKGERFDLEMAQKKVCEYLADVLLPTEEEELFWKAFAEGRYCPELIFGATAECVNVEKHPMALWKCRDKGK